MTEPLDRAQLAHLWRRYDEATGEARQLLRVVIEQTIVAMTYRDISDQLRRTHAQD